MKSYRKLHSKKNKTRNKKRRGGAANNTDNAFGIFLKFCNYINHLHGVYVPPSLFTLHKEYFLQLIKEYPTKFDRFDVETPTMGQKILLEDIEKTLFPNLSIVKKIEKIIKSNNEFSQVKVISEKKKYSLSLELEKHQHFIDVYKSIPEDKLTFDTVLVLLENHGLTKTFGLIIENID